MLNIFRRKDDESGTALLEACIVLPVLITLVSATFDLSVALSQYLKLSEIAYQISRDATNSFNMPSADFSCYEGFNTLENALTPCGSSTAFSDLRTRTTDLKNKYFMDPANRNSVRAEFRYQATSPGGDRLFFVRLSSDTPAAGMFQHFVNRVAVTVASPYFGN